MTPIVGLAIFLLNRITTVSAQNRTSHVYIDNRITLITLATSQIYTKGTVYKDKIALISETLYLTYILLDTITTGEIQIHPITLIALIKLTALKIIVRIIISI